MKNYTHENIRLGTPNPPREGLLCDGKSSSPHASTTFGDNNIYVGTNGPARGPKTGKRYKMLYRRTGAILVGPCLCVCVCQ